MRRCILSQIRLHSYCRSQAARRHLLARTMDKCHHTKQNCPHHLVKCTCFRCKKKFHDDNGNAIEIHPISGLCTSCEAEAGTISSQSYRPPKSQLLKKDFTFNADNNDGCINCGHGTLQSCETKIGNLEDDESEPYAMVMMCARCLGWYCIQCAQKQGSRELVECARCNWNGTEHILYNIK